MQMLDLNHFRSSLMQARDELLALAETRQASSVTVELDQTRVGRLSRMDALQQQAMARGNQERAAAELKRINAALRRCDDGSYGFCLECEEAIARERLNVDPAAAFCLQCADAKSR